MASPNLLITGATGFIGFKVLLGALQEGYTVRAAVRSAEKGQELAEHPKLKAGGVAEKLSFVVVPDICADGAYDAAIQGVSAVIHLASPLPSPFLDPQTGIYEPNIKSVSTLLQSALKAPSLKKLIITSSVFANSPFPPDPAKEVVATSRVPDVPGPFEAMLPAYRCGKVAALNYTDRFVAEQKPHFSIVNIFPGFVFGYDERAQSAKALSAGTNRVLLAFLTGQTAKAPMPAGVIDVADAAKVHLLALKGQTASNLGATSVHKFEDAWPVVEKQYPKAVADGTFSKGTQPTAPVNWNAHQTELDLGFKFKTYEQITTEVAGQYLELSGKEKA